MKMRASLSPYLLARRFSMPYLPKESSFLLLVVVVVHVVYVRYMFMMVEEKSFRPKRPTSPKEKSVMVVDFPAK